MTNKEQYLRLVTLFTQANMYMERTIDTVEEIKKFNEELSDKFYLDLSLEQRKRIADLANYSKELKTYMERC